MHHHFSTSNNLTDVLTAVGTLSAVITTVFFFFYEKIMAYINRPILDIGINLTPPECHKTTVMSNQKLYSAYWFRFFVINRGKSNANSLEAIIEKVERMEENTWKVFPGFLPSNLIWTHINIPDLKNLLPGTTKNLDFGSIQDPAARLLNPAERNLDQSINMADNVFHVNISVQPFNAYNIIAPGEYLFHIIVGAANSKAIKAKFRLKFTKDWIQDESKMLKENVNIIKEK